MKKSLERNEPGNCTTVLGAPSTTNFKYLIKSNQIKNCPVTVKEIENAERIFGKDIAYIKQHAANQEWFEMTRSKYQRN